MPTARVLASVVDQLDGIDMADSDTKGDLYEYMLGKIATAGQNGQFRTPRHIIRLMVDMTAPTPKDVICDPACGTAGFLVAASEHMPAGGFPMLLRDVAQFPTGSRPFAKGKELVAYGEANASLEEPKPMRKTEQVWRKRGVNVRSTLWNGPRSGAPFTVANLTLLAKVRRAVWPWSRAAPGLLVESFPAGQLHHWNLPHEGYDGTDGKRARATILEAISPRIQIPGSLRTLCQDSADALDAVLYLFSAKAAADGLAVVNDPAAAEREGWIAVHPRMTNE